MKLTPGKLITEIELPSIEGEKFSIKKIKGKKPFLHSIDLQLVRSVICEFTK